MKISKHKQTSDEPELEVDRSLSKFESMDDRLIWRSFKSGDESAFIYIYKKYFKNLHNYGFQFTKNDKLIEDAIQDLFIELRDRKSKLSDTDNIQPYLFKAYRRKIIRLRDREKKVFNELPTKTFELDFSIEDSIIETQTKEELNSKLKKAIENLSEQHREVLYHYFYKDFSYEEIKSILGYSHTRSVRNLMYKILSLLKESFPAITLASLIQILSTISPRQF